MKIYIKALRLVAHYLTFLHSSNLFIYFIGVLGNTQESDQHYSRSKLGSDQDHPFDAGRPFHLQLERKAACAGLEPT